MADKLWDEITIALDAANGEREWPMFCTPLQGNIKRIAMRAEADEAERDELARKLEQAQRELQHIRTMLDDGIAEYATALDMAKRLQAEHYALKRELSEAFNRGDGVYRP